MATTKTTRKAAKKAPAKKATSTKAKKAAPKSGAKLSAIDAAAKVLSEAKAPMTAKQMIDVMAAKKLWISPGGQTPHATLYSAMLREISAKGKQARFKKAGRGKFAAIG